MDARFAIILAAGKGTRMKSKLYKVLHPVCGKPMVEHIMNRVVETNPEEIVTIVGHGAEMVKEQLGDRTNYALQAEQLGTGHAVVQAESFLKGKKGTTLVISGDTPLLTTETLNNLFDYHQGKNASATILTAQAADPTGYGRIVRDRVGIVEKIVEQKDASIEEALIQEINTGTYCFDNELLFDALAKLDTDNAQGEYYSADQSSAHAKWRDLDRSGNDLYRRRCCDRLRYSDRSRCHHQREDDDRRRLCHYGSF